MRWFSPHDLIFFLSWHSSLLPVGPENLQNTPEVTRRNFRVKGETGDERGVASPAGGREGKTQCQRVGGELYSLKERGTV